MASLVSGGVFDLEKVGHGSLKLQRDSDAVALFALGFMPQSLTIAVAQGLPTFVLRHSQPLP